jgi:hypothetical protein
MPGSEHEVTSRKLIVDKTPPAANSGNVGPSRAQIVGAAQMKNAPEMPMMHDHAQQFDGKSSKGPVIKRPPQQNLFFPGHSL